MAKKYEEYSKEELIRLIHERDRKPKFGLVWERDEIDHDKSLNDDFVALELDPTLSVGEGPHQNLVIEGDNFDTLRYLRMTHAGKAKCIYIDPPYNTGNKDFIYNDHFVDKDDTYKHSKWLEFIYRRLVLAKDLLAEDGVIFVSIGEDEIAHLTLLMDQVFPGMKAGTFVWRRRSGANDAKEWFLSVDHEYVLCYANPGFSFSGEKKSFAGYSNKDNDKRGAWTSGDLNKAHTFKQRADAFYPLHNPETDIWYPCDPGSVWRFATQARLDNGKKIRTKTIEQIIHEKRVLWPQSEEVVCYKTISELWEAIQSGSAPQNLRIYLDLDNIKQQVEAGALKQKILDRIDPIEFWVGKNIGYGKPRYKRFKDEMKRTEKPISTWVLPAAMKKSEVAQLDLDGIESLTVGYTSEGTSLLTQMIGNKDFPYPKPLSLIKGLIAQSTSEDDLIIDFFAGSGTTGQAVMELNAEDEGNRRFILVSSTEATAEDPNKNVCQDVARKRLVAAIEGYSFSQKGKQVAVEGQGGSFAYLRTKRIRSERVIAEIDHGQVWMALQLIHIDRINPFDPNLPLQTAEADESHHISYASEISAEIVKRIEKLSKRDGHLTVYSWQPGLLAQRIMKPNVSFEQIPQYLMKRFGVPT